MTDISRKKFVRLMAAGIGSISTFFLTGFINRNKLTDTFSVSGDSSDIPALKDSPSASLASAVTNDPNIKPAVDYAIEQFDSGYT